MHVTAIRWEKIIHLFEVIHVCDMDERGWRLTRLSSFVCTRVYVYFLCNDSPQSLTRRPSYSSEPQGLCQPPEPREYGLQLGVRERLSPS